MTIERTKEIIMEVYPDATISEERVVKTNGNVKNGIKVNIGKVCPVFYPEEYFSEEQLRNTLLSPIPDFNLENRNVIECAVNFEKNKEILEKTDYRMVCDLAIFKKIVFDDIDEEGLKGFAVLPKSIGNYTLIRDYDTLAMPPSLTVITNKYKMYGAGVIGDTDYLKTLHKEHGDFYILPSSVHEIIIVPFSNMDVEMMKNMVKEINTTQVKPEEVLSDNVYMFKGEEVEIAE